MSIQWKKWEEQGELKLLIRDIIDTGNNRNDIVRQIELEHPNAYPSKVIHIAITELKKDLLISHCGNDYFKVTEWAHDAVREATGIKDWKKCLLRLKKIGVFHPDMIKEHIIEESEKP